MFVLPSLYIPYVLSNVICLYSFVHRVYRRRKRIGKYTKKRNKVVIIYDGTVCACTYWVLLIRKQLQLDAFPGCSAPKNIPPGPVCLSYCFFCFFFLWKNKNPNKKKWTFLNETYRNNHLRAYTTHAYRLIDHYNSFSASYLTESIGYYG